MRRALARVWQRFTYSSYRPYAARIRELQAENAALAAEQVCAGGRVWWAAGLQGRAAWWALVT